MSEPCNHALEKSGHKFQIVGSNNIFIMWCVCCGQTYRLEATAWQIICQSVDLEVKEVISTAANNGKFKSTPKQMNLNEGESV